MLGLAAVVFSPYKVQKHFCLDLNTNMSEHPVSDTKYSKAKYNIGYEMSTKLSCFQPPTWIQVLTHWRYYSLALSHRYVKISRHISPYKTLNVECIANELYVVLTWQSFWWPVHSDSTRHMLIIYTFLDLAPTYGIDIWNRSHNTCRSKLLGFLSFVLLWMHYEIYLIIMVDSYIFSSVSSLACSWK